MIEFLKRLFGQQGSSATAKERLRLVLMTDHLELAPEMIDAMKRDLVDVISRYVEVDREKIDVSFERQDRTLAMLANIPILAVNRPSPNGSGAAKPAEASAPPSTQAEVPAPAQAEAPPAKPPVRKRRKRKKSQAAAPAPATAAAQ
ncbi:MAG TPA: cell division topological specificity factor MinE [Candidatus Cybelea sp.]|jgi:cell division topological specificity factor|nr:cell division topological specificity factor MinE [Candidatus Cybelea sp.]